MRRAEYPTGSVIFTDLTVVTYNIRRMFPKRPLFTTSPLDSSPSSLADDANSESPAIVERYPLLTLLWSKLHADSSSILRLGTFTNCCLATQSKAFTEATAIESMG